MGYGLIIFVLFCGVVLLSVNVLLNGNKKAYLALSLFWAFPFMIYFLAENKRAIEGVFGETGFLILSIPFALGLPFWLLQGFNCFRNLPEKYKKTSNVKR